jgi:galactose-1-phosphate uridylyltransferase
MPLEFRKDEDRLIWIRNPFTGTVTYFTDIHKKQSGFPRRAAPSDPDSKQWRAAEAARLAELEAAQRHCPFCPGNEKLTRAEVLRVLPADVPGAAITDAPWLIRAFYNIIPRLPECCTGGRNESYVVVEDPRHFADGARHQDELLYTGMLPLTQFQALLAADAEVARMAYSNPAVGSVLIRKNQGRESGASQPHLHNQVIGADQAFPPILQEHERLAREPDLWRRILDFVEAEGFLVEQAGGCFLYFCPFGVFPRSYEIVCPEVSARITDVPHHTLDIFARLLHRALEILGPLPLDFEIHDGPLVPLHAHVSARHFPYSNIGGTLNLPANILGSYWRSPMPPADASRSND